MEQPKNSVFLETRKSRLDDEVLDWLMQLLPVKEDVKETSAQLALTEEVIRNASGERKEEIVVTEETGEFAAQTMAVKRQEISQERASCRQYVS